MIDRGVSIVICCHNSSRRLPETLKHIALQAVPGYISWEVIIVDNASEDETALTAKNEWNKYNCKASFSIIEQPEIGLSHARQKGFDSARYGYILFCDDDNWLQKDYVSTAYQIMEKNQKIGILGGHGEPVFEIAPPEWIKKVRLFAVGPQAGDSGRVDKNFVYGAGFVIRKAAYERVKKQGI